MNVSQSWRKTAQAIWSYKIQKHFNISPTSNRLANISSPLTCIEMNLMYYDILKLLPVTAKHILTRENAWAKRANPACCVGYFYLLFPWPAWSTFTWTWHVSPPNSHYSNFAPGADTNRLLLFSCFWSARSAHNLGMNFIYQGIAVLKSKFHFEIKDWDFLAAGSHLK